MSVSYPLAFSLEQKQEDPEWAAKHIDEGRRGGVSRTLNGDLELSRENVSTGDLSKSRKFESEPALPQERRPSFGSRDTTASLNSLALDRDEPKLKYQKVTGDVDSIVEQDDLSCIDAYGNTLALGSHWGKLYVLNLDGTERRKFSVHSATINDVCIDDEEEAIATASDDGRITVVSLYPQILATQSYNHRRPQKTVALDPDVRRGARQFCHAGLQGDLVFHERGWFVNKDSIIHSGEGPIYAVRWRGVLLAWSDDTGVKIFNIRTSTRVAHVERPPESPRPDLYRANLCWNSEGTVLYVGWAKAVQVVHIRERDKAALSAVRVALNHTFAEVTYLGKTDYIITGIVPYRDYVLVSAFLEGAENSEVSEPVQDANSQDTVSSEARTSEEENVSDAQESSHVVEAPRKWHRESEKPIMVLLSPVLQDGEISRDSLHVQNYEKYKANDYRLCAWRAKDKAMTAEPLYFLLSPKTIVTVRERDVNDHIVWLLEKHQTERALQCAFEFQDTCNLRPEFSVTKVGETYMDHMISSGHFDRAAEKARSILGSDVALWEKYIKSFASNGQLELLAEMLPFDEKEGTVLSKESYDNVLEYFLMHDRLILIRLLKKWPTSIYTVNLLLGRAETMLNTGPDDALDEALAHLYMASSEHCKALGAYTRLRNADTVFELVGKYSGLLTDFVRTQALLWMDFNEYLVQNNIPPPALLDGHAEPIQRGKQTDLPHVLSVRALSRGPAVRLLVTEVDPSFTATIVHQLQKRPKYLHIYLDALFNRDIHQGAEFHHMQLELYADFDYPKLGDFLRISTTYPLDKAYRVCHDRDLVPELVFVLGRMGDNKGALNVILERLKDIHAAIAFAKEQDDQDLWQDLIDHSVDKPEFVTALLANVGSHIDPIRLIRKIPTGLEIPNLKESLIKIMMDYNLQTSLRKGCERILAGDSISVMEQFMKLQRRGIAVQGVTGVCNVCNDTLQLPSPMVVFQCGHVYHDACVLHEPGPYSSSSSSFGKKRVLGGSPSSLTMENYRHMSTKEKKKFIEDKTLNGGLDLRCWICSMRHGGIGR